MGLQSRQFLGLVTRQLLCLVTGSDLSKRWLSKKIEGCSKCMRRWIPLLPGLHEGVHGGKVLHMAVSPKSLRLHRYTCNSCFTCYACYTCYSATLATLLHCYTELAHQFASQAIYPMQLRAIEAALPFKFRAQSYNDPETLITTMHVSTAMSAGPFGPRAQP